MEAVLAERGIGALFAVVCSREIAEGRLVPILPSHKFRPLDIHAIYPPRSRPAAKTKAFLTLLSERASVLVGEGAGVLSSSMPQT